VAATTVSVIPNEYIVHLEQNPSLEGGLEAAVLAKGGTIAEEWTNLNAVFVKGIDENDAADLLAVPGVDRVEQNLSYLEDPLPAGTDAGPPGGIPDHLRRISQRNYPLTANYYWDHRGDGVNVYVIDTGINDSHPELLRTTKVPTLGNVYDGCPAAACPVRFSDCSQDSHGTLIAALVGGNNVGVAPRAHVWGLRVSIQCQSNVTSDASRLGAFNWLLQDSTAPGIINMSLYMNEWSSSYDSYFQRLHDKGMLIIAAAGNSGGDSCDTYQGDNPHIRTVAGAAQSNGTQTDPMIFQSAGGTCIEMTAPGSGVISADNNTASGYAERTGTSQASAIVSGVAALAWQRSTSHAPGPLWNQISSLATICSLRATDTHHIGTPNKLIYSRAWIQSPLPVCPPAL
jgi:subtilisin family serine protease